jgi:hypothetical protein
MNRRSFAQFVGSAATLSMLGNAPGLAESSDRKTPLYRLDYLYLRQESQRRRVHDFLSSQMDVLARHTQALGVFTAVIGPRVPATLVLSAFSSFSDMEHADERLRGNARYREALTKIEADQPYDRTRVLLRAAEHSSETLAVDEKTSERVFELRVCHSPSEQQLHSLHACLAKPETGAFSRAGIRPIMHADTVFGPNMPNLTYLIPFANLAKREQAWERVARDPEWIRTTQHPSASGQEVVADITLLRPTPFSQIQ